MGGYYGTHTHAGSPTAPPSGSYHHLPPGTHLQPDAGAGELSTRDRLRAARLAREEQEYQAKLAAARVEAFQDRVALKSRMAGR